MAEIEGSHQESETKPDIGDKDELACSAAYQYHPLSCPSSIRILELFPGTTDDAIRVSLHDRTLSDLPTCEALSYQWGARIGSYPIDCGGKVLKVTPNLLAALKSLRRPCTPRLLWIDALCINQQDVDERSQQVALMRDIYQEAAQAVLWVGEEGPQTKEAFATIPRLARIFDSLPSADSLRMRHFQDPNEIHGGQDLVAITRKAVWGGVVDLFTQRTYFKRLWVIQEMVLASKAVIQCGSCEIEWKLFASTALLLYACGFLPFDTSDIDANYLILTLITKIVYTKNRYQAGTLTPWDAIIGYQTSWLTDPRDHVFGTVGMLDAARYPEFSLVDYTKSTNQVFAEASKWMILGYRNLTLWQMIHFVPAIRFGGKEMPSWALYFGLHASLLVLPDVLLLSKLTFPAPVAVYGDTLKVEAFLFDIVVDVSNNLRGGNIGPQVLKAYRSVSSSKAYGTVSLARKALWEALFFDDSFPGNPVDNEEQFKNLFSYCFKDYLGFEPESLDQVRHLQPSAKVCLSKNLESFSSQVASKGDFLIEADQEWIVKSTPEQAVRGAQYLSDLKEFHCVTGQEWSYLAQDNWELGRNIFIGNLGYVGVGPAGWCAAEPAVQAGDLVAIVRGSAHPTILRKRNDGCYTMMGHARIGCLEKAPCFQEGNWPKWGTISIR
jgi:hypothetical protein